MPETAEESIEEEEEEGGSAEPSKIGLANRNRLFQFVLGLVFFDCVRYLNKKENRLSDSEINEVCAQCVCFFFLIDCTFSYSHHKSHSTCVVRRHTDAKKQLNEVFYRQLC